MLQKKVSFIENAEDLRSVARSYGELRSQVIEDLKKLDNYSLILFKGFLRYIKSRGNEGLSLSELLGEFLSDELGLDCSSDMKTRLSLTKRFYNLARKHVRNPKNQSSLSQYLEV